MLLKNNRQSEQGGVTDMERRNMRCGILHGAFFQMGTAFADPYAVVPLFLAGFTKSRALIGLIVSLIQVLGIVPQLAMSRLIRRHPASARPIMLAGIWTRCGVWGVIALTAMLAPHRVTLVLIVFMCFVGIYSLGGGFATLPFQRIISETISPLRRSTFFGVRLVAGGILAVLAGMIVRSVLGNEDFDWPRNYGMLFALSFASLAMAYSAMSCLRFPETASLQSSEALPPLHKEIRNTWKEYPVLKRLIGVRLLSGGLPLVLPFLTLYATREAGIPLGWVGIFIAAQQGGAILANFGWMPLGNRCGTRSVMLCGLVLAMASLLLIAGSYMATQLTLAFFLAGAAMSAMKVGFDGYVLELGHPEIRPLIFALEGTLLMPLYFMPLAGGWLADRIGYRLLVLIGCALLFAAIVLARTLCEPRHGDPACGPYVAPIPSDVDA
jgi:MFS family permease